MGYFNKRSATNVDNVHSVQGCFQQASEDFTLAIEHGGGRTAYARECFYLRGMAEQAVGEHRAAIADFTRAIEMDAEDAGAYFRRWKSYREIGEVELADADFQVGNSKLKQKG